MKYIITLLMVLSLSLVFVGCGGKTVKNMERDMESGYSSIKDSIENGMDDNAFNNQNGMNGNENRTYTSDNSGSNDRYSSDGYMGYENQNMTAKIGRDEAKKIALGHAKVNESDIKDFEIELDKDNGVYKYDISFESGNIEYEYDVNAQTGEIMESSKEEKHNSMS